MPSTALQKASIGFGQAIAALVSVVALLVLVGWAQQIDWLLRIKPGWAAMTPNSALGLLLCALAIACSQSRYKLAQSLAAVAALLAFLTLLEHISGLDFGIDRWFFPDHLVAAALRAGQAAPLRPGLMSLATAIGLCGLSVAILLRGHLAQLANFLAAGVAALSLLALTGYLFSVAALYSVSPFSSLALHTAGSLVLLAIAVLASQPQIGMQKILLSKGSGGTLTRLLIPVIFPFQFGLAWLALEGQRQGLFGVAFAIAVVALFASMGSLLLLRLVAGVLYRADVERAEVHKTLALSAVTDDLTGLHNRRGFTLLAGQALAAAYREQEDRRLLFFDVDGLKRVNDSLGHEAGDQLIQRAAAILKESFRAADIVARLGGDEFALLTADNADSEELINRLQTNIDAANKAAPNSPVVALSVGVVATEVEKRRPRLEALLSVADSNMYEDKQRRRAQRS